MRKITTQRTITPVTENPPLELTHAQVSLFPKKQNSHPMPSKTDNGLTAEAQAALNPTQTIFELTR